MENKMTLSRDSPLSFGIYSNDYDDTNMWKYDNNDNNNKISTTISRAIILSSSSSSKLSPPPYYSSSSRYYNEGPNEETRLSRRSYGSMIKLNKQNIKNYPPQSKCYTPQQQQQQHQQSQFLGLPG
jgi:hypothetical protein